MHAWKCYQLVRYYRRPLPEWVLGYFDDVSKNLTLLRGRSKKPGSRQIPAILSHALGFAPRPKPRGWNPLDEIGLKDLMLAGAVRRHLERGSKLKYAQEQAADDHGVSERTARRAWRKHQEEVAHLLAK
jgi:hypothetical protein